MNPRCFKCFILFLLANSLTSQSNWEVFTTVHAPQELEFVADTAYVTTGGGLLTINLETGEEEMTIHRGNGLKSLDLEEIEILDNGTMYISADRALYFYDGENYNYYDILPSNKVIDIPEQLVVDEDRLWFSLRGNLVSLMNDNFIEHDLGFTGTLVGHNFDNNGDLWLISDSLSHYRGEILQERVSIPEWNSNTNLNTYYIDSDDRHWLGVYYRGPQEYFILTYKDEVWSSYQVPSEVYKFFEIEPGKISFSLRAMYGRINDPEVILDSLQQLYPLSSQYSGFERILNFEQDSIPWIATFNDDQEYQIYRYKSGDVKGYGKNDVYHTSRPVSLATDCSDIYVIESDEVQSYQNADWVDFELEFNNPECQFLRLATNPYTCDVWGFSDNFGCKELWWIEDGNLRIVDILLDDHCDAISFDPEQNVYVACAGILNRIDAQGASHDYQYPSEVNAVYHVLYATVGHLWVLTNGSSSGKRALYQIKDDIWIKHESEFLDVFGISDWLYEDRVGNLWLKEDHALLKYTGSDWERFPFPFVQDIIQDTDDYYWVAMDINGLIKWDLNDVTRFNRENSNISSDNCLELELVQDSLLWIRHYHGLSKLNVSQSTNTTEAIPHDPSPYKLYPNPTPNRLTLTNPLLDSRRINIFAINGELVTSTITSTALWTTTLEAGIYWVKLEWETGQAIEKVVVLGN